MCRACRAAIGALKADQRARELTAVGATLRQQGETIASDLAGYVAGREEQDKSTATKTVLGV
ncbi:hypothetical protein ACWD4T_23660, partial [Streptomyces umbrinus]